MNATAVKTRKTASQAGSAAGSARKPAHQVPAKPAPKAAAPAKSKVVSKTVPVKKAVKTGGQAASKPTTKASSKPAAKAPAKKVASTKVPAKASTAKKPAAKASAGKAPASQAAASKATPKRLPSAKSAPVKKALPKPSTPRSASKPAAPKAVTKSAAPQAKPEKARATKIATPAKTAAKAPAAKAPVAKPKVLATQPVKPENKAAAPSKSAKPAPSSSKNAPPPAAAAKSAKSSKVSDKSKTNPTGFQSPNPATLAELGMPVRTGRPSSRLVQLTVPSIAQSVASTGAKASFTPMPETHPIASPLASAVKKNAKLADNWKKKPVEALTDEEVIAMSDELYMNDTQLAFFRLKLQNLKNDILSNADKTTETLRSDTVIVPDPADRATIEEEHALELRTRDRERKLLKKIEQSIALIDSGEYGFCDETGEPIGVGRLLARPTATLSLEAQQRRELKQKMFGD